MLARRLACSAPRLPACRVSVFTKSIAKPRRSSTWTGAPQVASHSEPVATAAIQSITAELDNICPRFDIDVADIEVIHTPKDFFNALKDKIRHAKKRIYLATLYVGRSEHELLDCIRDALERNPDLKVSILTDALRGTRETPEPSCASLLSTLAADFPLQVEIRMYHTPNLTGVRKAIIPKRLNEGWGLQHMKLYGIDDEVILSGANLSSDYFTNRQDRYMIFSSANISDYFSQVYQAMCRMSFVLQPGGERGGYQLAWPSSNACSSPLDDPRGFVDTSKTTFEAFTAPHGGSNAPPAAGTASVYPVLIIPQVINTELPAMRALLDASSRNIGSCMFTAGYFNPDPAITSALLDAARAGSATTIVTASPWANGFYGSKGVSGMLPPAYTLLARRFLQAAQRLAPGAVEMREWRLGTVGRPHGWTYHSKGMWLSFQSPESGETASEASRPSVTIIGSSNYTVRSYSLDTEAGAVVVSADEKFAAKLRYEQENLLEHTRVVSEKDLTGGERSVGLAVRLAMWIVRAIGGSL